MMLLWLQNDSGAINENATLTVSDGDNQTVSGRYDTSGEHSGDVINTSWTGTDSDVDGDTLTVSAVRLGSTEGSGTAGTVGQALTGTYGQLTLNANGSYTYVANQAAAEALDAGDSETDSFNYTVTDGALTDTALLQIIVFGVNDTPVAQNDVGVIVEDGTLMLANGANANVLAPLMQQASILVMSSIQVLVLIQIVMQMLLLPFPSHKLKRMVVLIHQLLPAVLTIVTALRSLVLTVH